MVTHPDISPTFSILGEITMGNRQPAKGLPGEFSQG